MKIDKNKIKEVVDLLHKIENRNPQYFANICDCDKELATIIIETYHWCNYYRKLEIRDLITKHRKYTRALQLQIGELTQFKLDTAEKFVYGDVSKEFVISNTEQ